MSGASVSSELSVDSVIPGHETLYRNDGAALVEGNDLTTTIKQEKPDSSAISIYRTPTVVAQLVKQREELCTYLEDIETAARALAAVNAMDTVTAAAAGHGAEHLALAGELTRFINCLELFGGNNTSFGVELDLLVSVQDQFLSAGERAKWDKFADSLRKKADVGSDRILAAWGSMFNMQALVHGLAARIVAHFVAAVPAVVAVPTVAVAAPTAVAPPVESRKRTRSETRNSTRYLRSGNSYGEKATFWSM